jgi:hypothetical protein
MTAGGERARAQTDQAQTRATPAIPPPPPPPPPRGRCCFQAAYRRRPRRPDFRRVESVGMGVTSSMRPILSPERARARRACCAPGPGDLVLFPPVARILMCTAVMPSSCERVGWDGMVGGVDGRLDGCARDLSNHSFHQSRRPQHGSDHGPRPPDRSTHQSRAPHAPCT